MRRWKDLSIAKKLALVIGTMAVLILCELLALSFSMRALSAVRAFVGGESNWSKGQKDAAFRLQRFGVTRREEDFRAFLDHLKIPEGDHAARIELVTHAPPDMKIVRAGFIQGQVHPDDVEALVYLLRWFGWESHVARAVAVWTEADGLLTQFRDAGNRYHDLLTRRSTDTASIEATQATLLDLNDRLTVLEAEFSAVLGAGSRWLERVVLSLLLAAVLTVETIGLSLTFMTSRSLSRDLRLITDAASRIGRGELGAPIIARSRDEIGQLANSIDAMREALAQRDEFLSIATHELKTPLTSLHLRLQLLERRVAQEITSEEKLKSTRDLASASLKDTQRLARLLSELLDLTHLRLGKLRVIPERTDLVEIIDGSVRQISAEAAHAECPVEISAPPELIGNFDPVRLAQVITNLVGNAIKYARGRPIQINARAEGPNAVIEVCDQGPGIEPDRQQRIFDRYDRAGASERTPGLGLGLYITRQIVRAHGGEITVRSQPGQGCEFRVQIPVASVSNA